MTLLCKSERHHQGTPVDVYFRLFGPRVGHFDEDEFSDSVRRGNFAPPHSRCSPIIRIPGEYINLNGSVLVNFYVDDTQRLSPCSKLALGHDAPTEAADWLCQEVSAYPLNLNPSLMEFIDFFIFISFNELKKDLFFPE